MRGVPEKEVRSLRTALLIEPVQRCAVIRFAQAKRKISPDRPFDGSGSFWCMFRSPDFHRITLKTKRIICSIMIVLTPRTAFSSGCFFLKKEGVMKKTLLIFGLFLLFATEAKALSCPSGQFLYIKDEAQGCDGSDACKKEETCHKCGNGCLTCHGIRLWDTGTQWGKTWLIYSTIDSCDSCEIGYELKKSTTGSYDGSTYTSIPYYNCERKSVTCPANCSSCSSSSTCTACKSGYTLKNGACVVKNSGSGNSGKTGTVISCPDDMRLSADGCCCIAG